MKTHTEISGIPLREIFRWREDLFHAKRQEHRPKGDPTEPEASAAPAPAQEDHIKSPEERLAEFEKKKEEERKRRQEEREALLAEIREPISTKIKEKYQWEEEKIDFALRSLDVVDRKRVNDLRRVLVFKMEKEGERPPAHAQTIEGFAYLADYLPPKEVPGQREERGRRGKGGPRRGEGRGRPKFPPRGEKSARPGDGPPRGPRPNRPGKPGERGGRRPPRGPIIERKAAPK